jgi:hypothetical protein
VTLILGRDIPEIDEAMDIETTTPHDIKMETYRFLLIVGPK